MEGRLHSDSSTMRSIQVALMMIAWITWPPRILIINVASPMTIVARIRTYLSWNCRRIRWVSPARAWKISSRALLAQIAWVSSREAIARHKTLWSVGRTSSNTWCLMCTCSWTILKQVCRTALYRLQDNTSQTSRGDSSQSPWHWLSRTS